MYKYYISRWGIYYIFSTTAPYVSLHNHWATTKKTQQKMTSIGEDVEGGARTPVHDWWECPSVKGIAAVEKQ